ncbi:type IV secretion system protein [Rhizobacter sp. LjRoot28]|jgi:hypothetical protein|uniref:type IV secretion system protein n=1 Tax=Rhizobacter sp. LjRoot28 TaxID=3342309 RepID=UPI003ECC96F2
MTSRRLLIGAASAALLCAWAGPAQAAPIPALHEIFLAFERVSDQITTAVGNALGTAQVELVVNVLFSGLALGLFVWRFAGFALRGFDMMELLTLMMTIFFVYVLLTSYKAIFPPMFEGGRYVAEVLGTGISGRDGSVSMAEAIFTMAIQGDFNAGCDNLGCLGREFLSIPATLAAYVVVIILGIIATLVELWTLWGFQIAFAIGWVTIPFLLFERLSFLFDGWLKFFFGIIVYVIVAKVNLALVLLGLEIMFGVAHGSTTVPEVSVTVNGFFDLMGMFVFMIVGIATLYSTGKFASAIVNSAAGGGVGEVVQKAAQAAATVAGAAVAAL